ncbi:alpha/beta fold hydrolase [Halosquirtibacter laminarini]|uniref:Alpha/beta fold hydrolase n=1 Tax=Halosquirtibacter laminarini TaxID=3374600 RepID=A0AC61NMC2_9BACT|nr:alpha/beta fold hydrolase [Prolixibacteraceae bacterium]
MKNISFYSEKSKISGLLYTPDNFNEHHTYSAILLCHGFAGIKELLVDNYAKEFAKHGFVAMSFDYRGFGESEGETVIDPLNQIQDIYNASEYLRHQTFVDTNNLSLWGSSLGGANAILASAMDSTYASICVQLTFGNGERVVTQGDEATKEATLGMIRKLWGREVLNNKGMMVPLNKMLHDEQSLIFLKENAEAFPALLSKIPFSTLKNTFRLKAEKFIPLVEAPILIVGAENDDVNPIMESHHLYEKAIEPKELLIIEEAGHYDAYRGNAFDMIVKKQIAFFKSNKKQQK